jgi:hypothetical protein
LCAVPEILSGNRLFAGDLPVPPRRGEVWPGDAQLRSGHILDTFSAESPPSRFGVDEISVHPARTVLIGAIGGLIVGMTSVGSGSLMIVLLLFLYPMIGANQLVGTDLTQALPLTAAAALGALAFGSVSFGVTGSLIIGAVPAVLVGSVLSSRAPDKVIRPAITFVIFASGLKYVGLGTTKLGWTLVGVLALGFAAWLVLTRPWVGDKQSDDDKTVPGEEPSLAT